MDNNISVIGNVIPEKDTTILVIDDNILVHELIKTSLGKKYSIESASSCEDALKYLSGKTPDLVLLELHMEGMDGLQFYGRMKVMDGGKGDIPVIFITDDKDIGLESVLINAGAVDYVKRPLEPEVLNARISNIIELYKFKRHMSLEASRLAYPHEVRGKKKESIENILSNYQTSQLRLYQEVMTDELTGLANSRGLRMAFEHMLANPQMGPYALIILDLDYLAKANERHGRLTGDRYIVELAHILVTIQNSRVFRYGGDEFCIILTGADENRIVDVCNDIQRTYEVSPVCREYGHLSVSFGACPWDGAMIPGELMNYADLALYNAKKNRGCLRIYQG